MCKAAAECDCVFLGNTDIKETLGILLGKILQTCAVFHSRCDRTDFTVSSCNITKLFTHYRGKAVACNNIGITRCDLKRTDAVILTGILFRRRVALAFNCIDVDKHRTFQSLCSLQSPLHLRDIVTVKRSYIFKAEVFKKRTVQK